MITPIYAALLALFISRLSLRVIKLRRLHLVRYGDGGIKELELARAAQANAVDYIPLVLILLFFLEFSGASAWVINGVGVVFSIGRVIHARGIVTESLKWRVWGMRLTLGSIVVLAVLNLIFGIAGFGL